MDLLFDVIAVQINTPHMVAEVVERGVVPREAEITVKLRCYEYGPKDQMLVKVPTGKYRRGDFYKGA